MFECLANCSYSITKRDIFDAIPVYRPTESELAAPTQLILPLVFGPVYYSLTHGARVAIQRADRADEIAIKWIDAGENVTGRVTYMDETVAELIPVR